MNINYYYNKNWKNNINSICGKDSNLISKEHDKIKWFWRAAGLYVLFIL